jgi:lipoprotein-anchoring transpeptidase ErfK/SrfK
MYDMTRRNGLVWPALLAAVVLLSSACTTSPEKAQAAAETTVSSAPAAPTSATTSASEAAEQPEPEETSDPPLPATESPTEEGEAVTDDEPSEEATPAATPTATVTPSAEPAPAPPPPFAWINGTQVHKGDKGANVLMLQRRLSELGYDPGRQDSQFGMQTRQALWAFQHVNNLKATGEVDEQTSFSLAIPNDPDVLAADAGPTRVEVNIAKQYAVVYHGGKIRLITHISSGSGRHWCEPDLTGKIRCASGHTPRGRFKVHTRLPYGWRTSYLGKLYKPSYFKGGYALHGSLSVPNYPASHGCVRIPMHVAEYLVDLTAKGMPVIVV